VITTLFRIQRKGKERAAILLENKRQLRLHVP